MAGTDTPHTSHMPASHGDHGSRLAPAVGALLMSLSTVIVAVNAPLIRRARLA